MAEMLNKAGIVAPKDNIISNGFNFLKEEDDESPLEG